MLDCSFQISTNYKNEKVDDELSNSAIKLFIYLSKYNVETIVHVASGDSIGTNLINGNAYQKAINYLENFAEKSDDNYWKVSVNEFMRYINERSQIIIDQLSKKSHAVDIVIDDSDE